MVAKLTLLSYVLRRHPDTNRDLVKLEYTKQPGRPIVSRPVEIVSATPPKNQQQLVLVHCQRSYRTEEHIFPCTKSGAQSSIHHPAPDLPTRTINQCLSCQCKKPFIEPLTVAWRAKSEHQIRPLQIQISMIYWVTLIARESEASSTAQNNMW